MSQLSPFSITLLYCLGWMWKVWMWVRHDGSAWIGNKGGLAFLSATLSVSFCVFLIQRGNSYHAADLWRALAVRVVSGLEHSDLDDLGVITPVSMCERHLYVGVEQRCWKVGQTDTWTLQDYIFESKVQLWTGVLSISLLLIGAQRAFLSCESEDWSEVTDSTLH